MGNCIILQGEGKRRNEFKVQRPDLIGTDCDPAHEGIKTIGVEKTCSFSTGSVLCVCIVTWNMNGKVSSEDLAELVGKDRRFDLLAVGLQEVPKCNIRRLLQSALDETHRITFSEDEVGKTTFNLGNVSGDERLRFRITEYFSFSYGLTCFYTQWQRLYSGLTFILDLLNSLLAEATMQSLQLFVFGPKKSELYIKDIRMDKHAVRGCGGAIGRKKGAVAININYNGIRIVFISCHLSAHECNVEQRNAQCRHISHSLFSKNRNPYARPSHLTVWLGDLNYRIQGISTVLVRSLIHKNKYNLLTGKDQLLQEASRGQVFNGYCEGTLSFKPTYKYDIGSSIYDTSYKIRVPSWTDRILFKVDGSIDAALHEYEAIDNINSSDHKPVRAHLCLKLK